MDLHRKIKLAVGLMAGTLTMVNFFRLQECVVLLTVNSVNQAFGYYWLSDYFTIIDDFGKQYMVEEVSFIGEGDRRRCCISFCSRLPDSMCETVVLKRLFNN